MPEIIRKTKAHLAASEKQKASLAKKAMKMETKTIEAPNPELAKKLSGMAESLRAAGRYGDARNVLHIAACVSLGSLSRFDDRAAEAAPDRGARLALTMLLATDYGLRMLELLRKDIGTGTPEGIAWSAAKSAIGY